MLGAVTAAAFVAAHTATAGSIFVIAMENHNLTQPVPTNNPQQIFGNPAAPYLNSLMTPGHSNAVQSSYATNYHNSGQGVHPSEPNYVWAEAGTDFGVHTDADPRQSSGNTFFNHAIHLTAQLDAAGISWKNYQEDFQLGPSATNSVSGTNGPVNPYYGTMQFNYAVKHNPMAFFADSAVKNVYPLDQLFADLANHNAGKYNWITPNQFNDAHSALSGGFTYQGTNYTGDQASIAQGDNFLSLIVPQIMASSEYQDNGAIIIWWDETEGGDDASRAIPEIVISPLAKGNAYVSPVLFSHSSDIKTMEEIFKLPFINNAIPLAETNILGGYNNVATVNDLSDLFVAGSIPTPATLAVSAGKLQADPHTGHVFQQVQIKNTGNTPVPASMFLVLDNLSTNATVVNSGGLKTAMLAPLGSPYVSVNLTGPDHGVGNNADNNFLQPNGTVTLTLEFLSTGGAITYDARVLTVTATP
jgi:hypothetical protein